MPVNPTVTPQEYAALTRRAQACVDAGRLGDAEGLLNEIVRLNPREHNAWGLLARLALEHGQSAIAQERIRRALELDRRNADYLNVLGIAQAETGDLERAEATLRRALRERPTHADAHYNLGKAIGKRGDLLGARREYERTLSLDPRHQGALGNLALAVMALGDPEGALRVLDGSVADGSADPYNMTIFGSVLEMTRGRDAAIAFYADACRRQPGRGYLRRAHAHARLMAGDYAHGWQEFLGRNLAGDGSPASIRQPLPQHLGGRAFHLLPEMGLGDVLFFLRFAPELVARGATVSVTAPDKLARLLARTGFFAEVTAQSEGRANETGETLSVADLPGLLQSEAPVPVFRLVPDATCESGWRKQLAALGPPPYIGVTWRAGSDFRGSPEFGRERLLLSKAIAPETLGAALRDAPGTLVSLQRQPRADEAAALSGALGRPLHDFSATNEDLDSMAGLLGVLDEYVAVSNTNVHLRAGLGHTSRVLVPYPPEWRWMSEGDESPWFPGCRVYRQPPERSWARALEMLRSDLCERATRSEDRPVDREQA